MVVVVVAEAVVVVVVVVVGGSARFVYEATSSCTVHGHTFQVGVESELCRGVRGKYAYLLPGVLTLELRNSSQFVGCV